MIMGLGIETLMLALFVLTLNVLDSVTTRLCFKQYPDKEFKGEANPIMRLLMLKSRVLAEVVKQIGVLVVVVYLMFAKEMLCLRFMMIMFGLVVLNNTAVVVSRAVLKRKATTPIYELAKFLHVPDKYKYAMALLVILQLALIINHLVWGI